jgi:hypothetical protein
MGLRFTVGGTKGTFEDGFAAEMAEVLEHAFGAEGDWEGLPPQGFGELTASDWDCLQKAAIAELGAENLPNLMALDAKGRGVFLPTPVQALRLEHSRGSLDCASLPGLRNELAELAPRWGIEIDDSSLILLVRQTSESATMDLADAPEIGAFARLSLAANEAVRRDCPLWIIV